MEELLKKLDDMGANTKEGLERVLNKEGLYLKCLRLFTDQAAKQTMQEALDSGDYQELLSQTHTFKGTTGNISLIPLYEIYSSIVADIRAEKYDGLQEQLTQVLKLQEEFCSVIDTWQ